LNSVQVSAEDSKVFPSQEDSEALETPLLRSEVDEFGDQLSTLRMETTASAGSDSIMFSAGPMANPSVRRVVYRLLQVRTTADALPSVFQVITTSGKLSAVGFLAGYIIFVALWFPFWLLSFVVSEWGVYAMVVATIFLVGRAVIRMIAFPGSSARVSSEIENEFSKYSVRMLLSSTNSLIDLASAINSTATASGEDSTSNQSFAYYEIPSLWKRAKSYRDRVLSVYAEVLTYILKDRQESIANSTSDLTKYGNNRPTGDIGDLSGLTVSSYHSFGALCIFGMRLIQKTPFQSSCSRRLEQMEGFY
jgi:hypothetical protein